MMKKNGFTLAEVLITLAIIGVVATMTLPALMTNTQEQQAKTGLKKGINTLTEVGQLSQAISGIDYSSLRESADLNGDLVDSPSIEGMFANHALIDRGRTGVLTPTLGGGSTLSFDATIYFRDGSSVSYNKEKTVADAATNGVYQPDQLPLGFTVMYDYNGAKMPNVLSNCSGVQAGADESAEGLKVFTEGATLNLSTCNNKATRVIKDQFLLQLRGTYAVPLGKAATWVMSEGKSVNKTEQQGGGTTD